MEQSPTFFFLKERFLLKLRRERRKAKDSSCKRIMYLVPCLYIRDA